MVKAWQAVIVFLGVWAVGAGFTTPVEAQLDTFFYIETCPQVYPIVAKGVYAAILNLTRNAASLLRLQFHDCFVQGCDGSILLDSTDTIPSEQLSFANINSIRGIDVISTIKGELESSCPGIVSCADTVVLSAFFSVVLSGGPAWPVLLGRRDSFLAANSSAANGPLPSPFLNFTDLQNTFFVQNLTDQDLVALSGAHTIGLARCNAINRRIYNFSDNPSQEGPDPTLNTTLLASLEKICPFNGDLNVTTNMDLQTPTVFDNLYYQNLLEHNGLFRTDQDLLDRGNNETNALVNLYASDQDQFFADFSTSMINLGNLRPLTGTEGEIRLNCSVRNPVSSVIEQVVDSAHKTDKSKTEENRQFGNLKRTENIKEFFKQVLKLVAEEIAAERRARVVEDTVTSGYSSV